MSIQRTELPADKFTMISNQWVRDRRLGWKARGILTWLASHAVGFKISETSIVNAAPDGKHAVRGAVEELETLGYLTRTQQRISNGTFGTVNYILSDPWSSPLEPISTEPTAENQPSVVTSKKSLKPQVSTDGRFSDGGEPVHIRRTNNQKTKTKKTKDQNPASPLAEGVVADRNASSAATTPPATSQDISRMAGDVLGKLPAHYRDAPVWLRSRLLKRIEEALHADNSPQAVITYAAKFVGDPNFNQFEHLRQFADVVRNLTADVAEGITCPGCGLNSRHPFCPVDVDGGF